MSQVNLQCTMLIVRRNTSKVGRGTEFEKR